MTRDPDLTQRVEHLLADMSLEEKLAQLVGLWANMEPGGDVVAPLQHAMQRAGTRFDEFSAHGLGQLTRPFGTTPVDPAEQRRTLADWQRWLVQNTRLGIHAQVHEECLTGLATWRATTYPAPPSWGASFDPDLVERMAAAIGAQMRALGVHQGLAPVLDVIRDQRWGRVEECIAEDPYVVGTIGAAYVRGLQSQGPVATLKHFVGYSNSRAGRNLAPSHAGPREVADVLLVPFEMALADGGARSVMHSYADVDGVPAAADRWLLTELLRAEWGFTGTVVADYFGVAFLHSLHGVAEDLADAADQALAAGVDVELPTGNAYLEPLAAKVRTGAVSDDLVDRAVRRVLRQKGELGLLDTTVDTASAGEGVETIDLDPPEYRQLAGQLAEESVVLLTNHERLPLTDVDGTIAVVGPNADDPGALMGCYSFANHVLPQHPEYDLGLRVPTVFEALQAEFPRASFVHARGCDVADTATDGFAEAVAAAREASLCVVVVGDRAGLFGRGTSGEGCDTEDLEPPGAQRQLVEQLTEVGTPVVLALLTGRGYVLGWAVERCAAIVQTFFPGEEGAAAVAGVLSGRVNPSGRLPMSMPRSTGAQPFSYLHPPLGGKNAVTNLDSTPQFWFGHGLSYTSFSYHALDVADERVPTDGWITVTCAVTNTGDRFGTQVVQLYAHDPVASVTRPLRQLVGYARVDLDAGASARVRFEVPTTRLAFSGRDYVRIVEPGDVELFVGEDCASSAVEATVRLTGDVHPVTVADARQTAVTVTPDVTLDQGSAASAVSNGGQASNATSAAMDTRSP